MSFSSELRKETVEILTRSDVKREWCLALVAYASGQRSRDGVLIETRHKDYASWLQTFEPEIKVLSAADDSMHRFLLSDDYRIEDALTWLRTSDEALLALAFSLLFSATGSMTDPKKSSHLEFRLKNQIVAAAFSQAAAKRGIDFGLFSESRAVRLYLKDSQLIGEMLVRMGAMRAFLHYSALKVDKEVLNQVNRQVNCDRANARRVANASGAQAEAILLIEREIGLSTLSDALETAARARLMHPDLSLAELGTMVSPPVGKSGMNHRMKKLMELAASLTQEVAADA